MFLYMMLEAKTVKMKLFKECSSYNKTSFLSSLLPLLRLLYTCFLILVDLLLFFLSLYMKPNLGSRPSKREGERGRETEREGERESGREREGDRERQGERGREGETVQA